MRPSARTFFEAVDREEQLTATLSAAPSVDDADRTLLRRLNEEQAAALRAFMAAADTMQDALDKAKARDFEPDEKGGT